jgi:hypothetical protein
MLLVLSRAACEHIAYSCNERAIRDSGLVGVQEAEDLRLLFVRGTLGHGDPLMFEFTRAQLRVLDMLLTDDDPRQGKLPDGTPVIHLVQLIWRALIGESDAHDEDDHPHGHAGKDEEAALHRS